MPEGYGESPPDTIGGIRARPPSAPGRPGPQAFSRSGFSSRSPGKRAKSRPGELTPASDYERRSPETTNLHRVVRENLEVFLARARSRDRLVPRFVERAFRSFLRCAILAHGFLSVHCDACGHDRLVGFSCKGRGISRSRCATTCPTTRGSLPPPTAVALRRLVEDVVGRTRRLLARRGLGPEADPSLANPLLEAQPPLSELVAASVQGSGRLGVHSGLAVCEGFTIHAAVEVPASRKPARSCLAKCTQRVHFRRAPGRKVAG
jgi:transposase-like zinc-binding protein